MNSNSSNFFISTFDFDNQARVSCIPKPPVQGVASEQEKKQIGIPSGSVGLLIGKGGEIVKQFEVMTGARILVSKDMDADSSHSRRVDLSGTRVQISEAEELIKFVIAKCYPLDEGGSQGSLQLQTQSRPMRSITKIPNKKVALVSEAIEDMQQRCSARIQVIPLHLTPGYLTTKRILQIDGTYDQIQIAEQLVAEVISENRVRNPSMGGQYTQQGYQARAPTSWAPPGPPMQQASYGFMQQLGAYPGQYNMPQPRYPGYPPQPEAADGYSAGWDQTIGAPNQQSSQGDNSGFGHHLTSTIWAPPGPPMQQASYGFMQQLGAYHGQYNMPPPQYPGYLPQPAAAGGYSAGWDQTTGAPHQQSSQGGTDNSGFGYYQQPATGYNQQAQGYCLPQTNPTQGYDPQQGEERLPYEVQGRNG